MLHKPKLIQYLTFFIISFLINGMTLQAQDLTHPESGRSLLTNFTTADYNAGLQNWAFIEDDRGIIYVGNSDGVLEYDGITWRQILLSNRRIVRSLAHDPKGRIWVGGVNDLGYLSPDSLGQMFFVSLKDKVPEAYRNFESVWNTYAMEDGIYFKTNFAIFRWNGSAMKVWPTEKIFHLSFVVNNTFYIRQNGVGLLRMEQSPVGKVLRLAPDGERFAKTSVYVMLPYDADRILIGTREEGLFIYDGESVEPFPTEVDTILSEGKMYSPPGVNLPDGHFGIGLRSLGFVVINHAGQLVKHIKTETGLLDNNVLMSYVDTHGNIWLGLGRGMARLELGSPTTHFMAKEGLRNLVFATARHDGKLFTGDFEGLKRLHPFTGKFRDLNSPVVGVYSILTTEWDLLITSINRGVYRVVEDETIPVRTSVSDDFRAVRLHQWSRDSSLVLVGLRDGLALLRRSGEDWIDEGRVPKLNIDAWYIAEASNGDLWLGSQSSRVARVRLPEKVEGKKIDLKKIEVTVYGPEDGIIEGTLRPFSIDGKIYITGSGETVFSFDEANERFSENPIFNGGRSGHPLGNFNLREDNKGRVWITSTYGAPVIAHPQMDESYTFEVLREFRHKRIIDVYPEPDGVVWLMGEYELIRYDMKNIREAETLPSLLIRQVLLREDILLYGGFGEIEAPQIAYGVGAVRFSYSAPGQSVQPQFRTKMDGFDESWSSWTADSERSYTNLPPGNYSFRVESDGSDESAIFQITVLPPWYRTWWAYGIYFLLIIVILDVARRLVKRRAQLQERKKFELKQAQHSLSEKETLLKEIHHRVKNNLQLVSGILELQASKIDDKKVRDKLHEGQKRLGSMALIHELLYQGDDLGAIDFKEYVLQLTNDIAIAFGNAKKKIEMHVEVNDVRFDVNTAVPLGLIITELITNTYRHAFINKRKGNIYLKLKAIENGDYQLTIQDDGKGMPKGFDYNKVSSLGIRLVNGLTRQLEGSLEIQNGIGTIIIINFKDIHEHE